MRLELLVLTFLLATSARAGEPDCPARYALAQSEAEGFAMIRGVVVGTIYGHSLTITPPTVCISGTPLEKVQAISKVMSSEAFAKSPVAMDDVPSRDQAVAFLERFFPCK